MNDCAVTADWTSELQTKGHGPWDTVQTQSGTRTFAPGDTVISGNFCYVPDSDTHKERGFLTLNGGNTRNCTVTKSSPPIDPCQPNHGCANSTVKASAVDTASVARFRSEAVKIVSIAFGMVNGSRH